MKFKKLGALILGAILTVGIAAGVGLNENSDKALAATSSDWVRITDSTISPGEYLIVKVSGDKCMAPVNSDETGETTVNAGGYNQTEFSSTSAPTNGFIFEDAGNGKFYIKDGICFVRANGTTNNGLASSASNSTNSHYGIWNITETTTDGEYTIINDNERQISAYSTSNWRSYGQSSGSKTNVRIYQKAPQKNLNSIDISLKENKDWYEGDTVAPDDLKIFVSYSDSTSNTVTDGTGVTINSGATLVAGDNTLSITYTDSYGSETKTITITALAKRTITNVQLEGDMTKKSYYVGDNWDLSGLYLDVTYSVGENEEIQLTDLINGTDYLLDPETADKTSISEIYIAGTYKGCDFDGTITGISVSQITYDVLNRELTGVTSGSSSYTSWLDKTSNTGIVYAGQSAGGKDSIQLRSNNNNSGIISTENNTNMLVDKIIVTWQSGTASGRTLDVYGKNTAYSAPTDLYSTGTQGTKLGSITCGTSTELEIEGDYSYIGLRSNSGAMYLAEVKIYYKEVVKKTVTSLEVTTNPNKMIYSVGEDFNSDGMVVTATYSDSSTEDVTASCTFNPSLIANDTNEITISYTYEGNTTTCTLPITLKAVKNVTGLASMPNVYVGDTVDAGQFELNVEYNDDTTGTVQADEVNLDTTTAGVKEATATYNGASNTKTITFEVEVYGLTSLSWTKRGEHVAFAGSTLGEAFNTTEWMFTAKYNDENETQLEPSPVFGTGENDVHIALYDVKNPETENTPLTSDYVFTLEDDGKFLVASYRGIFSSANNPIDVVERLNNITHTVPGSKETEIGLAGSTGDLNGTTISWEKDGVVVTNEKGSSSNDIRTTDTDHYRCYANSILKINSDTEIEQIVFTCTSSEYAGNLVTSIGNDNATNNGTVVTWKSINATSITITLSAQVRIKSVVVSCPGEITYEYANNNLKAQAAVMKFVNFFNTTMRADGACGDGTNVDYNSESFVTAWNAVSEKYAELITNNENLAASDKEHANNMLVYATPYWANEFDEADPLQEAMRTYDKVVSNSELAKFITGRPKVEDNSVGLLGIVQENSSMTIVIIALAALSAFAFVYVARRKQRKIEL